jgi:cytochrome c
LLAACTSPDSAELPRYGFGREVDANEISRWDIDVRPDGQGLPPGRGTVAEGEVVYQQKCAACHGTEGQGGPNDRLVAAYEPRVDYSRGLVVKTVGNYWPYATTLYDYINRAMPHNAPGSLNSQEVYSLAAWLLFRNGIIAGETVIDQNSLPRIEMPAAGLFYWSDEVSR